LLPETWLRVATGPHTAAVTKTQYYTATSIDGYIADEDNSLDWLFEADSGGEGYAAFDPFFADVGAFCMGATTFEWVMAHEGPEKWREMWGDVPCWVFTHRDLATPGPNVMFVSGDVAPVHREMVEAAEGRTSGWWEAVSWSGSSPTGACSTRSSSG
jgi:dihydrofolate reductase